MRPKTPYLLECLAPDWLVMITTHNILLLLSRQAGIVHVVGGLLVEGEVVAGGWLLDAADVEICGVVRVHALLDFLRHIGQVLLSAGWLQRAVRALGRPRSDLAVGGERLLVGLGLVGG